MSTINTTHAPSSTQTTMPTARNGLESRNIATLPVASFRLCSGVLELHWEDNRNISQKQSLKIIKLQSIMAGALKNDNTSAAKAVLRHGFNPNSRVIFNEMLYPWIINVVVANVGRIREAFYTGCWNKNRFLQ